MFTLETVNLPELVIKYLKLIDTILDEKIKSELAYVIDLSIGYIKKTYGGLSKERKSWLIMVVRNQYLKNKINSDEGIIELIDDFVEYHEIGYENFINESEGFGDVYDKDENFMYKFLKQYNAEIKIEK